jgi:protein-disulfide isomerase
MALFRPLILAAAAIMALVATPSFAADAPAFTDAQKSEIENVVKEMLSKNPEVIVNAMQAYQSKATAEADKKAAEQVAKLKDKLFDPKDPIDGNPKGTIQVVEFFDYNCGYCKKVHDPMMELLKTEKDVKFIYKQFPILSESSKVAAKVALAADMQGKYRAVHEGLMAHKGALDEATVMDIATKAGVDKDKLKKDMEGPEVTARLSTSMDLANAIGAHGTPTFIFEDKVVPGAMGLDEMKKLVQTIRDSRAKKTENAVPAKPRS